jgi:hypothetical protein
MIARTASQTKHDIQSDARYSDARYSPTKELTKKQKGAIVGTINKAVGGDQNRYALLAWLFDSDEPLSTKELTESQWDALWTWVDFYCDELGQWHPTAEFETEAMLCLGETTSIKKVELPQGTLKKIMAFLNGTDEI